MQIIKCNYFYNDDILVEQTFKWEEKHFAYLLWLMAKNLNKVIKEQNKIVTIIMIKITF